MLSRVSGSRSVARFTLSLQLKGDTTIRYDFNVAKRGISLIKLVSLLIMGRIDLLIHFRDSVATLPGFAYLGSRLFLPYGITR